MILWTDLKLAPFVLVRLKFFKALIQFLISHPIIGVIGPGCTCQFCSLPQRRSGALTLFSLTADIRKKFAVNNVIDQIGRSFFVANTNL